ncbi:MAG TPA: helix-turn-helix transcriptional regulator [Candidatus Baltobacteraceae bacterium]
MGDLAQQLAAHRDLRGISLEDAARAANIEVERLADAEAAETILDEDELERLADVYGVGITAFFGGRITPKEYLFGG